MIFQTYNKLAINMISALGNTKHSKIIDMRHNYIKAQLQANRVRITQVRSDDQDADIFTKPLGGSSCRTKESV